MCYGIFCSLNASQFCLFFIVYCYFNSYKMEVRCKCVPPLYGIAGLELMCTKECHALLTVIGLIHER